MIEGFADQGTRDIAYGVNSPAARRACPQQLWPAAQRRLDTLERANSLEDLANYPGNRLETFLLCLAARPSHRCGNYRLSRLTFRPHPGGTLCR